MTAKQPTTTVSATSDTARNAKLAAVIRRVIQIREGGQELNDAQVIAEHPDLLPELPELLKAIPRVEEAERTIEAEVPIPKRIGRYHIRRVIASGGMGTVYEAVQEKPRRTVAVKLMRAGLASRSALRRFEFESQLLARLRHTGIAEVYEAGTHRDRDVTIPYFAMEYIPNAKRITDYVNGLELGTRERMKLFCQVCDAVHHGHQKGIIHRDLKPGNILVDSGGRPKVIDFGVARSTDSDMAVTSLQTRVGQIIGTVQYMSPEQCEADPLDIDTRSDVYALGVVLFELLTGQLPYDVSGQALHEATRIVCSQEPIRPSSCTRSLRGDPETIVLKALEKNRERRYQSAAELRQDMERYLVGEPIAARPASTMYVFRMFVRRNKTACAALAAVFSTLILATTVSTRHYWRADAARRAVVLEREQAVEMERVARQRANQNGELVAFFRDMLGAADPNKAQGKDLTVRELLHLAGAKLPGALQRLPAVEATLRSTIGLALVNLGHPDEAERHLRRAVELNRLAGASSFLLADALKNLSHALDAQQRLDECYALLQEARDLYAQSGFARFTVEQIENDLAGIQWRRGEFAAAESVWKGILEQRREYSEKADPLVATSCFHVSLAAKARGEYGIAERLAREALSIRKGFYGDHTLTATSLNHLSEVLLDAGDYDQADRYSREALTLMEKLLGPHHASVAAALITRSGVLLRQGQVQHSLEHAQRALDVLQSLERRDPSADAVAYCRLGEIQLALDRPEQAEANLRRGISLIGQMLPRNHWFLASSRSLLGSSLSAQGRLDEAESLLEESLQTLSSGFAAGSTMAEQARNRLATFYAANGRPEEAARTKPQ